MYEEFFRLSDSPFRLNPDPRFFFGSRSHNKAMAYLHYGLKQAEGFIVITGPVGAGKSMVIGHLLDQLNSSNVIAANLLTSNIEPNELLSQILSAFRIEPEGEGRAGEIEAFEDYLFDQLNRGRRVLLIIDEAQNLPFKTLEELRMLSNLDYEGTPLFQVFLVGQPEFRTMMEAPHMEQLRQRVIASYHLEPLSAEETRDYILHRLAVAGWREDPDFSKDAFKAIHEETGGLPRRINTLCNRLMLYCSLEKTHAVKAETVAAVCKELREESLSRANTTDALPPVVKAEARAGEPSSQPNVVPIEAALAKASTAQKPAGPKPAPVKKPAASASSSNSVLDRLRAKKEGGSDAEEARQEATLTDVASAIAAVQEAGIPETATFESDADTDMDSTDAPHWRRALVRSIDETREELKEANANVIRLTRSVTDGDNRRKERRARITDSLTRAESLLDRLRASRS
ncbi:MAG: XrtA-associated ATPase [Parvularculaceae bacterium]